MIELEKDIFIQYASAFGRSARRRMLELCKPIKDKFKVSDKQFNKMMKVNIKMGKLIRDE